MSRVDDLNRILRALQSSSPDVEACALISEDGLMIASVLPQHVDESRIAGMSATLSSLGTRAATELERGDVQEVLVRGDRGLRRDDELRHGTLLLGLASKQAKLGLLFLDMRRAIEDLRKSCEGATMSNNETLSLYDAEGHKNVLLEDFTKGGLAVQANQHLIVHGKAGMLLDPGGHKVYSRVLSATMQQLRGAKLQYLFLSHQDPDIVAATNGWLMTTDAVAYCSALWTRFVPHFGLDRLVETRLLPIPITA